MEYKFNPTHSLIEKQELIRINDAKGLNLNSIKCARCKFVLPLYGCRACVHCNKYYCFDCAILLSHKGIKCKCNKEFHSKSLNEEFYKQLGTIDVFCQNINHTCHEPLLYKDFYFHMYGESCYTAICPMCHVSFQKSAIENHYFNECLKLSNEVSTNLSISISTSHRSFNSQYDKENFYKIYIKYSLEQKISFIYELLKMINVQNEIVETNRHNIRDRWDIVIQKIEEIQGEKDSSIFYINQIFRINYCKV